MKINEQLSKFEQTLTELIKEANHHLAELPDGELKNYPTSQGDTKYDKYYVLNNGNRKYLPKDDPAIKLLAKKMYYQKLSDIAKANLEELNFFQNCIPGVSASDIFNELPGWASRLIDFPQADEFLVSPDPAHAEKLLNWQKAPYFKKSSHKEGLKHRTSDGTLVRSKSEALILEKIKHLGIANRYECGYEYEPGKWLFPDVTMMRTDTKLFYLEHCGLMSDPRYVSELKWKLGIYEKNGIVPWDNLILTFDDSNGNIDLNLIEAVLKSRLILF